MADDRLFAAPANCRRPLEHPGCDGNEALHRHVFAPAERAADLRVLDYDLVFGQRENFRELLAVFVQPLPSRFDNDAAVFIDGGDAGIGLQVGVFLPLRRKAAFDDDVGLIEGASCIAVPNLLA